MAALTSVATGWARMGGGVAGRARRRAEPEGVRRREQPDALPPRTLPPPAGVEAPLLGADRRAGKPDRRTSARRWATARRVADMVEGEDEREGLAQRGESEEEETQLSSPAPRAHSRN